MRNLICKSQTHSFISLDIILMYIAENILEHSLLALKIALYTELINIIVSIILSSHLFNWGLAGIESDFCPLKN